PGGAEEGGGPAEGHRLRSLHGAEGAELRLRLPARRGDAGRATGVLRDRDLDGPRRAASHPSVIIDRAHRRWVVICLGILAVATAIYVPYHMRSLNGPTGGSLIGLIFGFVGYGLMLFAGALGLRTRRPTWRLGRAETWLKGHV